MLEEKVAQLINARVGIPQEIRDQLIAEIVREIELAKLPTGRKEGATVMTEAASLAADAVMQGKREPSKHDPKPRVL